MAYWVKCTSAGERGVPVYVNLDAMLMVTKQRGGSIIVYAGSSGDMINEANVTESPDEIFALPRVEYGARRTEEITLRPSLAKMDDEPRAPRRNGR